MASFNRVIIIGNLTRDPDYKQQSSGQAVCKLSIASNRQFKNKQNGTLVQEVCYIDVDVWGNQAESCKQYLEKGRPVLVEGRLKYDQWESEGQIKRRHSIVAEKVVFLGSSNQQSDNAQGDSFDNQFGSRSNNSLRSKASDILAKDEMPFEDDLPF